MNRAVWLTFGMTLLLTACGDDSPAGQGGGGGSGGGATGSGATSSSASSGSTSSSGGGGQGPYEVCDKTGESNSVGAGPGDLTCFANYACGGGALKIECDGADDGTASCTCFDGGGEALGTCDEPTGVD